jgi:general secretion pathway protein G
MLKNRKGFTLIELLIVVAIIGIIAAIAIPNLLNAIQRGKQKRTMADMRAIATSAEAYAVDNNVYPAGGYDEIAKSKATTITAQVTPTYIKQIPEKDGWSTTFYYGTTNNSQQYQVRSLGKDASSNTALSGKTQDFNADIVFENGSFVVFPEGVQT